MISTRLMDVKLREAAEGLGEDSSGKKKSKFKTFKKFFGKKKRKESASATGKSTWKQNPAKSEVIAVEEAGLVGYDSEDELEESRGALGSRALSHDSIFIPEAGQDPARPVRVFSQENVCDRIKALQLKIQRGVRAGPPPGGLPVKRAEDAGMSSEDDGLPRSPPELSLLPDAGPGVTIKVSLVSSSRPQTPDHTGDATGSPRTSDSSPAPMADFSHPPESSSCLDNSAAKHKLLVKPRHQRSKMRRLSSRAQSEILSDLTWEEYEEKPSPKAGSGEESPGGGQPQMKAHGEEPGGPVALLPPGGARARRARLQHSPALSASVEDAIAPGDDHSHSPETPQVPQVAEPVVIPAVCRESPTPPDSPRHPGPDGAVQEEELPPAADPCPPAEDAAEDIAQEAVREPGDAGAPPSIVALEEGDVPPPETLTSAADLETASDPGGLGQGVPKEAEPPQAVPGPEEAETGPPPAQAPSPVAPRSCLKPRAVEPRPGEASAVVLDTEAEQVEAPQVEAPQVEAPLGPERPVPPRRGGRGSGEPRANKRFSVTSGRARARPGSRAQGPSRARLPLMRGSPPWKSEAALDDLQPPLEPEPEPARPAQGDSQEPGDPVTGQAGPGRSPQGDATMAGPGEPCLATQESSPREDTSPFPVKLRSTSLSLKYREGAVPEARSVKRHSAEVRLERGLTLPAQDEPRPLGPAPTLQGSRPPSSQARGKARPPLPRKPLLPSLTLPYPPAASADASPAEPEKVAPDPRKEGRAAQRKPSPRGAGADGPPTPPWITAARQKRRGAPEPPASQEDSPGAQLLKPAVGKPAKAPEKAQEPKKQADFVRSKSFLMTPAKPSVTQRQGAKLSLKEGLQRGVSLSHQNLAAQSAAMTERELHQPKRASYASADQPSWMELARKKSQAWSDRPHIIK